MAFVKKRHPNAKTWSVVYDYIDGEGVKRKKWESGYATRKLANERKAEVENQQAEKSFITPSLVTVEELFEQVMAVYGVQNWEPKTYELNESLIRNHIKPELGKMPVQKVTPLDIEKMFLDLRKKKVLRGKGEDRPCLSSTTLRLIHSTLKKGFELAVQWKMLRENPVKIAPPERSTTEASIWTPDVMFEALMEMKPVHEQLYLAAHTAYVCAMRIGEAMGLQWENVDFANDLITINKTLQRLQKSTLEALAKDDEIFVFPSELKESGSVLVLKKPKTRGSNRSIHMPPKLKHELLMRKQLIAKQKAYHGKEYSDYDLVFCKDNGRPVEPHLCEKWFTKFQKRSESGFPKIKFHEIRHSIATFLVILSGGNPAAVQKVTGHQSPEVLMRTYNHATKGMVNELSLRFETIFYDQNGGCPADEVRLMSLIPQKDIKKYVERFELSAEPGQNALSLPALASENLEQRILTLLDSDPTLRENLLVKLSAQTMQSAQE